MELGGRLPSIRRECWGKMEQERWRADGLVRGKFVGQADSYAPRSIDPVVDFLMPLLRLLQLLAALQRRV